MTGGLPTAAAVDLGGKAQGELHALASEARNRVFGRRVFVRAVVEASNYCRENCGYCGMRRDNRALARYRSDPDALAERILRHRPPSVTDINIQTGEDPRAVEEAVLPLLRTLRRETNLGLSVCLGTLSPDIYGALKDAGASIYIMKFEAANSRDYTRFQAPGTLEERLDHIRLLANSGWSVSSGFIAGLPGLTSASVVECLQLAASLPLSGCSVSPFVPGEATPFAGSPGSSLDWTLNAMALLRLARPDWVIPAVSALNLAGSDDGYLRGLRTGANLCTINLTPDSQRGDYLLYKRDRVIMTEERILEAISKERLEASRTSLSDHFAAARAQANPAESSANSLGNSSAKTSFHAVD